MNKYTDEQRILRILEVLEEEWGKVPDLRFGELVVKMMHERTWAETTGGLSAIDDELFFPEILEGN